MALARRRKFSSQNFFSFLLGRQKREKEEKREKKLEKQLKGQSRQAKVKIG
jgi:hypothetical protein